MYKKPVLREEEYTGHSENDKVTSLKRFRECKKCSKIMPISETKCSVCGLVVAVVVKK